MKTSTLLILGGAALAGLYLWNKSSGGFDSWGGSGAGNPAGSAGELVGGIVNAKANASPSIPQGPTPALSLSAGGSSGHGGGSGTFTALQGYTTIFGPGGYAQSPVPGAPLKPGAVVVTSTGHVVTALPNTASAVGTGGWPVSPVPKAPVFLSTTPKVYGT